MRGPRPAARRTPLIAAGPKMLFPVLVILPGLIASALNTQSGGGILPVGAGGHPEYNMVIPSMLAHYFPPGLLGLGFLMLFWALRKGGK